jgi:hypothetical protein
VYVVDARERSGRDMIVDELALPQIASLEDGLRQPPPPRVTRVVRIVSAVLRHFPAIRFMR